jgi:uncharacterized membrane protein YqaE (UPF0057 family)
MIAPGRPGIGTIIAAILLPPLGVWLARGIGAAFWMSLLLTCIAFFPGILFALVVVCTPSLLPGRASA